MLIYCVIDCYSIYFLVFFLVCARKFKYRLEIELKCKNKVIKCGFFYESFTGRGAKNRRNERQKIVLENIDGWTNTQQKT